MFGTDDVIYVPEDSLLVLDDIYRWKRFKFNVHRTGLRIRTAAFDIVSERIRTAMDLVRESPRYTEGVAEIIANSEAILKDMAGRSGSMQGRLPGSFEDLFRLPDAMMWLRLSDLPAESFFEEDYPRNVQSDHDSTPHFVFGNVNIEQLDKLEVDLPGTEEDGLPFSLDFPQENGIGRFTIPPTEPISLVHEYCGAHGASAFGRTVNLNTNGQIAETHQFCTPLGRLGGKLFATLYCHYPVGKMAEVVGPITPEQIQPYIQLLEKSNFQLVNSGPTWRIFDRDGDIVHLYDGLAGKETEGVETMPPIVLVASAAGQFDPMHRAELFEALQQTI